MCVFGDGPFICLTAWVKVQSHPLRADGGPVRGVDDPAADGHGLRVVLPDRRHHPVLRSGHAAGPLLGPPSKRTNTNARFQRIVCIHHDDKGNGK